MELSGGDRSRYIRDICREMGIITRSLDNYFKTTYKTNNHVIIYEIDRPIDNWKPNNKAFEAYEDSKDNKYMIRRFGFRFNNTLSNTFPSLNMIFFLKVRHDLSLNKVLDVQYGDETTWESKALDTQAEVEKFVREDAYPKCKEFIEARLRTTYKLSPPDPQKPTTAGSHWAALDRLVDIVERLH